MPLKEKVPICPNCLSLLGKQANLFFYSHHFLYEEKNFNTLKSNEIGPLTRQPSKYLVPVTFGKELSITFEKEARNNFRD